MDDNSRVTLDSCVFCKILQEKDEGERDNILLENEKFFIIKDIKPATDHHYLIISKNHIKDVTEIKDHNYIQEMKDFGIRYLYDKCAAEVPARLGFHWPPFHSVKHLHLHVISPEEKMGWISRIIFKASSWWFVSPDYILNRLKS